MKTVSEIQDEVRNAKNGDRRRIFEESMELKYHLGKEHGLDLIAFNELVGFTSVYKDKMLNEKSSDNLEVEFS